MYYKLHIFCVFCHQDERARILLVSGKTVGSGQSSLGFSDQVAAVFCLTKRLSRQKGSIVLIHMNCSVR